CLAVVGSRDEMLLAFPHLQGERALRGFRQQLIRLEALADLARETESVETARREHHGVETALAALPQPGVDVAAQRFDRKRRLECEQLRLASRRRSPDAHPRTNRVSAAEGIARIVTLEIRADDEPVRVGRRHVL